MAALIQRQFAVLSVVTALLFVLTGVLALQNNRYMTVPSTIQQAASHISSVALLTWMGREIPRLHDAVLVDAKATSMSGFLFQLATGIHPGDLRGLLGRELPGLLALDDSRLIAEGSSASLRDFSIEYPSQVSDVPEGGEATPQAGQADEAEPDAAADQAGDEAKPAVPNPSSVRKNVVYVYTTHNRESWVSEAEPSGASLDHPTRNISLVSKRLAKALNERGIGSIASEEDIYQRLLDQNLDYALSYAQSLQVLQAAQQEHRELQYFFDLHRDTAPRDRTTVTIQGKTYGRVLFIIGKRNKNHQQNEAFAAKLHSLMEEMYPGLSRGVMEKGAKTDHGEYNQSISPGSLLLEIGGIENTLEECLNTAEALADVFAAYYFQAEKVAKPEAEKPQEG